MARPATHAVPSSAGGIATWPVPEPTATEGPRLAPGLEVAVLTARADGWAQIECSNGWVAWVDGRLLEPLQQAPTRPPKPAAAPPPPSPTPQSPAPQSPAPQSPAPQSPAPQSPAPQSPAPPRTSSPPAPARASSGATAEPVRIAGVRISTPLVAGVLVIAGPLLPWVSAGPVSERGLSVPLQFLLDPKAPDPGGLSVGVVVLSLGAAIVAGALGRIPASITRAGGGAAMLLATVYFAQLQRALGQAEAATALSVLGMGVYVTLLGGALAALSTTRPSS